MRIDECQFGGSEFLLDRNGVILRLAAGLKTPHARHQRVVIQVQAFGDGLEVLHLEVFARQVKGERGMVIHYDAAIAVQNLAARRQHRDGFDAVLHGAFLVERRIAHLQVPKSGDQEQENADHEVLEERDLAGRKLTVVVQKVVRSDLLMVAVFPQFHRRSKALSGYLQFIQNAKQRQSNGRVQEAKNQGLLRIETERLAEQGARQHPIKELVKK